MVIRDTANQLEEKVHTLINQLLVHEAIEQIIQLIRDVNRYVEKQAPWKAAQSDLAAAGRILYTATDALRIASILLSPVMPERTQTVLEILGAVGTHPRWGELNPGTKLQSHEALFPRLEVPAP